MENALIRQAAESDVASIIRLQRRWLEEGNVYGFVPEGEEEVRAALGPYLLVAAVEGEVVGFVKGSVRVGEETAVMPGGESYVEVEDLYVAPEFRGRGVGGELLNRLLERAGERGAAYALLYSASKNVHSVLRFYERHDFRSWYVRMFRKL